MIDEALEPEEETSRLKARLAESLLKKRDEAVEGRVTSGVERRWREDEDAFDGLDETNKAFGMVDYATGTASALQNKKELTRSKVVINVVRGKSEMAEGRFADILLPVDDRNWGLRITPVPQLVKDLKDTRPAMSIDGGPLINPETQQQATNAEVAQKVKEQAKEAMRGMEKEIDDQLVECSYNGECRKVARDAIRVGTGILKGPNVVRRLKKTWVKQEDESGVTRVLKVEEDYQPGSKRVDYWNVFPDPHCGDDTKRAAYIWERDYILPREVRDLVGVDGYDEDQLRRVLEETPLRVITSVDKSKHLEVKNEAVQKGKAYEKWEYYGDISREDLEAIGVDCSQDAIGAESLSGCVVFINNRPVKVMLNSLDTGDLPYDFFQWTTVNGSPWGIGIPRILVWLGRVIIAAWRAMMDNAGDSSGANIIVSGEVEPDDGIWEIKGKKIWRALGEVEDVRKAFAQFQLSNNQKDLEAIINLALRFVDMETSLPMLFKGEQGETPETLGATNIMVDANNVGLRPKVKLWDDAITRPHLTRYYHWNMQYNDKEEIKGDYTVDARGTSELLAKDQMVQVLYPILRLREDPLFKGMIDWDKAIKLLLSAQHLDILKSEEDYRVYKEKLRKQPPPKDPKIQGAIDVATIRAEGELKKVELQQQYEQQVLQFKSQMAERDLSHELQLKNMDWQIKIMEYAMRRDIGLDKVKGDLAMAAQKLKVQVDLAKSGATGPQITKPPVEPEGRAKEGRAFPD